MKRATPKVVMGRMRYPDGREVPPELEAQVWAKVAADLDHAIIRALPPEALTLLARLDKATLTELWPFIRKVRLGHMTADEFDTELRRIEGQ